MQTLTVSQRLQAYKWALENFRKSENGPFLCQQFDKWLDVMIGYELRDSVDIEKTFPEFLAKKPERLYSKSLGIWFDYDPSGNAQREALLRECIRECEGMLGSIPETIKSK